MNTSSEAVRKNEIEDKIRRVRELMGAQGLGGVRLRGVDWFAWATAGANSVVIFTNEAGIAEVLITPDRFCVVTNRIESRRLREEELPASVEVKELPWADSDALESFVRESVGDKPLASDKPAAGEQPLPKDFLNLRLTLSPSEIERYRVLGLEAAQAMREALGRAKPEWTENELAGEGARACWARGLHPTLVLVAGESRLMKHRHPFPHTDRLGARAMMVFCARRHGLYANLTRFVYFRKPTAEESRLHADVAKIEAAAFRASQPGATINSVYDELDKAYQSAGHAEEILKHHQGGPTGYLSRESIAVPSAPQRDSLKISAGTALAWNPSLTGFKIEDTVVVQPGGQIEVLTNDPEWPSIEVENRRRPDVWVRA